MITPTSPSQLIIILVVVLLLFGAKRIPGLMKSLGTGMREFRKGTQEDYEVGEGEGAEELPGEGKPRSEQGASADKS